jgi:hypothetical protein
MMSRPASDARGLPSEDIHGVVNIDVDGRRLELRATGQELQLVLPAGFELRSLGIAPVSMRRVLPLLDRLSWRVDIVQNDRALIRMGPRVDSRLGGALLGSRRVALSVPHLIGAFGVVPSMRLAVMVAAARWGRADRGQ